MADHDIVEPATPSYPPVIAARTAPKASGAIRRNTRQRDEIRAVFEQHDRPLGPDEVLVLAQKRMAGIGIATVYRTIKALAAEGWLVPVELPGAAPRYEMRGKGHHHHFHCLKCGKLFELEGCLERLGKLIPPGFRVVDHVVLIYGFCEICARPSGRSRLHDAVGKQ